MPGSLLCNEFVGSQHSRNHGDGHRNGENGDIGKAGNDDFAHDDLLYWVIRHISDYSCIIGVIVRQIQMSF